MASCPPKLASLLAVAMVAVGCAGEPATFSQVQAEIFRPSCSFAACHGGANGRGGLVLDGTAADHARLLQGTSAAGRRWVVPGDPDASYLVAKLRGDAGIEGDVMPPAGKLDDATIERLVSWIEAGAPAN